MKRFLLLTFLLFLAFSLSAETWNFRNFQTSTGNVSTIYQSLGGLGIKFQMQKLNIDSIIINNKLMNSIIIPEIYSLGEPGKPYFPRVSRLVAIPNGAQVQVQLQNLKSIEIPGIFPWCNPESIPYNVIDTIIYKPDSSVYYGYRPYPENIITISEPFKIRGLEVVKVVFEPFQWNPTDSTLKVYTSFRTDNVFNTRCCRT